MYQDDILKGDSTLHKGTKLSINACVSRILALVTEMSAKTRRLACS